MNSNVSRRSTVEPNLSPGTILDGKYVVQQQIGAGGMGRVYVAIQKPFNRKLVIKVMHPDHAEHDVLVQRFAQEAQAISRLSHPNTVTVFDFGRTDAGVLYIVMEYVEGIPLGDMIRETGALPLEDAVAFTAQVAQALGEAHHLGIVHRDLKPDNIMVVRSSGSEPFVKVLDFGIAKLVEHDQELTQAGSIVGTPAYMAPEQARNDDVDARTDLYALGCCLYEMLTGGRPYPKETPVAVLLSHQNEPIPHLPEDEFGCALNDFLKSALAKSPEDRPADASEFVARMMRCFMDSEQHANPAPASQNRTRISERMRILDAQTPRPGQAQQFSRIRTTDGRGANRESSPSLPRPKRRSSSDGRDSSSISVPAPDQIGSTQQSGAPAPAGNTRPDSNRRTDTRDSSPPAPARGSSPSVDNSQNTVSSDPNAVAPEYFDDTDSGRIDSSPDRQRPQRQVSRQDNSTAPDSVSDADSSHSDVDEHASTAPKLDDDADDRSSDTDTAAATESSTTPGQQPSPPASSTPSRLWPIVAGAAALIAVGAVSSMLVFGSGDESPQSAVIELNSDPEEATVYIDDVPIGRAPIEHQTDQSSIESVRFERSGFETKEFDDVEVRPNQDNRLFAELQSTNATLRVVTDVEGADVIVDDRVVGQTTDGDSDSFGVEYSDADLEVRIVHPELGEVRRSVADLDSEIRIDGGDFSRSD